MAEPYIGEIRIMSFNYAPKYWAQCNGQIIPVNQNQPLYALLGTTYGGDGINNFGLPDLRGRVNMHFGSGYYRGQIEGRESVPLTAAQAGSHNHGFHCSANNANFQKPKSRYFANANVNVHTKTMTDLDTLHNQSMTAAGSGAPHDNVQPSLVINYCIALQGTFPSRN